MWWTLARPSEAAEAEWAEFDLDAALWTIPARRMKARREHVVPLPTQAIEMLRRLHAISGDRTHIFPGRDDRNRPMSVHSIRQALKVLGWSGTYSPHGTRTTGSTRLNEMGYRPDAIEAQLAHAEPNSVRRTYNHATCVPSIRIPHFRQQKGPLGWGFLTLLKMGGAEAPGLIFLGEGRSPSPSRFRAAASRPNRPVGASRRYACAVQR